MKVHYGGQALIEGVLMRGRAGVFAAVRAPDGRVLTRQEGLPVGGRRSGQNFRSFAGFWRCATPCPSGRACCCFRPTSPRVVPARVMSVAEQARHAGCRRRWRHALCRLAESSGLAPAQTTPRGARTDRDWLDRWSRAAFGLGFWLAIWQ